MSWSSLKTKLVDAVFGDIIQERVRQSILPAALGGDPSLYGFRRLSASGQDLAALRDLPIPTQDRMQEMAYYLYLTNPMARWLIRIQSDYIVGEGVTLKAEDPDTQGVLDAWWTDAVNNWPKKLPNKVRELALYGEQCYPAFVSAGSGTVRLGYLDPCLIQEVILDPDNAEQAIGLITKKQTGYLSMPERRFRVILALTEDELTGPAQRARESFTDGECFYFAINKVSNGSRGISDLLDKADWLDGYERFMFNRLERAELANRVYLDLELQGFTQEQINAFLKTFKMPAPGGVNAHNEKSKFTIMAPDLKAQDAAVDARLFKHQCLAGYPDTWYGGGADANRATAGEMDEPTFKMLSARQREIKCVIEECGLYAVRQAKRAGVLKQAADETFQAQFPEMVTADLTKLGAVLAQVAQAVAPALVARIITKAEARTIFAVVVKNLGVELAQMDDTMLAALAVDENFDEAAADYTANQAKVKTVKLRAL